MLDCDGKTRIVEAEERSTLHVIDISGQDEGDIVGKRGRCRFSVTMCRVNES